MNHDSCSIVKEGIFMLPILAELLVLASTFVRYVGTLMFSLVYLTFLFKGSLLKAQIFLLMYINICVVDLQEIFVTYVWTVTMATPRAGMGKRDPVRDVSVMKTLIPTL